MSIARCIVGMLSAGMIVLGASGVSAQDYPNKPIRIMCGSPGGGSDFVVRLIAPGISGYLGKPVIVDNRSGNLPGEIASNAPADGYTLLFDGASFWVGPLLQKTPYDVIKDFSPVAQATTTPGVLVVHPSFQANSVKDLIALAKANPGKFNYGSGGVGSSNHLPVELFKSMAGVNIVHIPFKGGGPAVIGLLGGQVELMIAPAPSLAPHIKSGKVRALAVTSAQPSMQFPGMPTVAASGVPGYEAVSMTGMFAPAKIPPTIIKRLNQEIVRFLNQPDTKEKLLNAGTEAVGNTPEQFAVTMKADIAKWAKVIKDVGIQID